MHMKRRFALLLSCVVACTSWPGLAVAADASVVASAAWPLMPMPASIQPAPGTFDLHGTTRVLVQSRHAKAMSIARQFVERLAKTGGPKLAVETFADGRNVQSGAIIFSLDAGDLGAPGGAGYRIEIDSHHVRVAARDPRGLFHAGITLWQLLTAADHVGGATRIANGIIVDRPRFAWRGMMLDSARHMQSVAEIEKLLEQMAEHKLNVLHWHLTDDQGWRLPVDGYPELTRIGAWRKSLTAASGRYGGFYTHAQIRAVVAYAAARFITVVPEIDMPGHAQAAVASYPRVGVTGKRPQVSTDWGVNPWLFNVDDQTFTFIDAVLDQVMTLFPSRYIHVGGDEAIKGQWQASSAVRAKMKALGITDADALQAWFMGKVGRYLSAHGRTLVGWDEILDGKLPTNAVVMSWRGNDGAVKAAKLGHDVVLAPSDRLYFNQLQSHRVPEIAGRLPIIDLASVYAYEPVPTTLTAAQARHVLGAQANVWTEYITSPAHLERSIFPRLDALSEVLWSPRGKRDWRGFLARLPAQLARERLRHVDYSDSAFAADITLDRDAALASGVATVTLSNQADFGAIHYTLDGSQPGATSPLYHAPIKVSLPRTVRAVTLAADGSELAAPQQRKLDRAALLSFNGTQLANCPDSSFRLRVQPMPDATSLAPTYAINVFDSCQMVPALELDHIHGIQVTVARLERNYALAQEASKVRQRPHATPAGELRVYQDRCDGSLLATLPLPAPQTSARRFQLGAQWPAVRGKHALCLMFGVPTDGPIYALGQVVLTSNRNR